MSDCHTENLLWWASIGISVCSVQYNRQVQLHIIAASRSILMGEQLTDNLNWVRRTFPAFAFQSCTLKQIQKVSQICVNTTIRITAWYTHSYVRSETKVVYCTCVFILNSELVVPKADKAIQLYGASTVMLMQVDDFIVFWSFYQHCHYPHIRLKGI